MLLGYDNLMPAKAAVRHGLLEFGKSASTLLSNDGRFLKENYFFFKDSPRLARLSFYYKRHVNKDGYGKILTGGKQGTRRKPGPRVTLCTISHTAQTAIETGQPL